MPTTPALKPADDAFRYDAFISYRHVEPDRQWARWLHRGLETYRVPKKLVRSEHLPARLNRIFRDEDELPASSDLNNEIESALLQSRFLIVVCSPRTPLSQWVNREVERFRELGRHDRILALLIEGEPRDAFPRSLCEIRRTAVDALGQASQQIEEVEPLAADVRESRGESGRHLRRMALLRMLACLLGCRFDDLRRREQERRQRQMVTAGGILIFLAVMMGLLAIFAVRKAQLADLRGREAIGQRNEANAQRVEAEKQRRAAQLQLAWGQISQGDTLLLLDRILEARALYGEAMGGFAALNEPTFPAELGAWDADYRAAAPSCTDGESSGPIFCMAISRNGRTGLSGNTDGTLTQFDLATGKIVRTFHGHEGSVMSVAISNDGLRALSGGNDKTVRLWDLARGLALRTIKGRPATYGKGVTWVGGIAGTSPPPATSPTWAPPAKPRDPGLHVGEDREAPAVPVIPGADVSVVPQTRPAGDDLPNPDGHGDPVEGVAFSPDGLVAISASLDNTIKVWDLESGRNLKTLSGHSGGAMSVAISPDNRTAISAGEDGTLKEWNLADGSLLHTLRGHMGTVQGLAISADGHVAISCGKDGTLKVWDLRSGESSLTLVGHAGAVKCVAISGDGHTALSGGDDRTLRLWDLSTGKMLRILRGHDDTVTGVAISADGCIAASCGYDGRVMLWDLGGSPLRALGGHKGAVNCLAISPDGRMVISGSDDCTVKVWDLATGKELLALRGPSMPINSVAITPDGRSAVASARGGTLTLWDLATGLEKPTDLRTMRINNGWVTSLAITPDGKSLLTGGTSGGEGGTLMLWDLSTGKFIRGFKGHGNSIESVAITADGRRALSGGFDTTLKLWDLSSGGELQGLVSPHGFVYTVAISPDSRTALAGDSVGNLSRWDLDTGRNVHTFRASHGRIDSVAIFPDGRTALTGDSNGKVTLWDLRDNKELRTFADQDGPVNAVAVAPEGYTVITGGGNRMVKAWDFGRAKQGRRLAAQLSSARAVLQTRPDDPAALATLGRWYAFEGLPGRAIVCMNQARQGGTDISPVDLARCFWAQNDLPSAAAEFRKAIEQTRDGQERFYLNLCLKAVSRN